MEKNSHKEAGESKRRISTIEQGSRRLENIKKLLVDKERGALKVNLEKEIKIKQDLEM